jgi:hypothetical protein
MLHGRMCPREPTRLLDPRGPTAKRLSRDTAIPMPGDGSANCAAADHNRARWATIGIRR